MNTLYMILIVEKDEVVLHIEDVSHPLHADELDEQKITVYSHYYWHSLICNSTGDEEIAKNMFF